jgi:3',5'-cyclic AMP phosphodiesterase CpdA
VTRTLAHISDLHFGRDAATDAAAVATATALRVEGVDEILVTGDVTHRGRDDELSAFERAFAPIRDRLVLVPGNHDRLGDDVARTLMPARRVDIEIRAGLFVVRVDSTAAHNSRLASSHGDLCGDDLAAIERAVASAPRDLLVAVMLHHHVLPLPEDHLVERVASWLGLPNAAELHRGRELVEVLLGRCDLVLHGHRHAAAEFSFVARCGRPLRIVNAGCTPDAGRVRVVTHARGKVVGERWLERRRVSARRSGAVARAGLFAAAAPRGGSASASGRG